MRNSLQINGPANNECKVPLEIKTLRGNAAQCMAEGVKWLVRSKYDLQRAKFSAAVTGYYFLQAKRNTKDGDWGDVCAAHQVARTTADRYASFAEFVVAQGGLDMPGLDDESRLLERGINAVMDSPRPWTALLRYAGMVEKQGQYDPERYQQRKTERGDQPAQLEFDFGAIMQSVRVIRTIDADHVGRSNLVALREELASALASVDHKLRTLNGTIDA
jgi:hypothetical protein